MKAELAIIGAYKEMRIKNLFNPHFTIQDIEEIRKYLQMVYAIGFDEGRKQLAHEKPVEQYDMEGNFIQIFESITIAARIIERDKTAVMRAAQGKSEYAGGFKWKYVNNGTP